MFLKAHPLSSFGMFGISAKRINKNHALQYNTLHFIG